MGKLEKYILAIDQGTTNTKVSLVDKIGAIVKEAVRPVGIAYPQPGWVEQDPQELWESTQLAATETIQEVREEDIAAVAVTNQRETVVIWERKSGKPVGPAVVWQCRRSAPLCAELRSRSLEKTVYEKTGLTIDPMFSAGKARWLLDHIPNGQQRAREGEICLGTVDSWILWNLTGGRIHACDVTNASRTQLFNLHTLEWDDELLDIYGIPRAALPEIRLSSGDFGKTTSSSAKPAGIPGGLPIASLIGDSHAALFGHAGFQAGSVKATYGTGSSLMTPTLTPIYSSHGLSTSIAWGYRQVTYALEGNIYVTGAAVQWLTQFLGLENPMEVEALAHQVEDTEGLYFVPALVGLGAPHWKESARGLLTGLTRSTTPAHVARATLEAIAYQIRDVFEAMQMDSGVPLTMLLADGGATRNDLLMQFQADILGVPVLRSRMSDASALGTAYLAGLAIGMWASESEIASLRRSHDRFEPRMEREKRAQLYAGWKQAIERTVF